MEDHANPIEVYRVLSLNVVWIPPVSNAQDDWSNRPYDVRRWKALNLDWDKAAPAFSHATRTHFLRHLPFRGVMALDCLDAN